MAEFTVRPARPEDTGAAYELFAEWQRSSYGEVEIGPEMFATTLAGADAVFVAETEEGVVGQSDVDGGWIGLGVAAAPGGEESARLSSRRPSVRRPPTRRGSSACAQTRLPRHSRP